MSLNRKQRRVLAKRSKGDPSAFESAGDQIGSALEAVQKLQGLEGSVQMLSDLGAKIEDARAAMEALAQNVQELDLLLEIQREVNLRLLSRLYANDELSEEDAFAQLQRLEQGIREKLVEDLIQEQASSEG